MTKTNETKIDLDKIIQDEIIGKKQPSKVVEEEVEIIIEEPEEVTQTVEEDEETMSEELELNQNELALVEKSKELLKGVSDEDRRKIIALSRSLDSGDEIALKDYGLPVQQSLSRNADAILAKTKISNTGMAGDLLNDLMYELGNFETTEKPKLLDRIFKKAKKIKYDLDSNFSSVEGRVLDIVDNLNEQKKLLNEDVHLINGLIENNQQIEIASDIYIRAGDLKIEDLKLVVIPELSAKLDESPTPENEQKLMEVTNYLGRLEKRVMDLRLTQQILRQATPQLNIMKNGSYTLSDKIESSINNAIPTWKSQIAMGITLRNQENVIKAEQMVADTTNKMLQENSKRWGSNMISIAKANERGIVDIATLREVNDNLINTVKETMEIQKQGRIDRAEATIELKNMEEDMRRRLLEIAEESGHDFANATQPRGRKNVNDTTEKIGYKDLF